MANHDLQKRNSLKKVVVVVLRVAKVGFLNKYGVLVLGKRTKNVTVTRSFVSFQDRYQ
jgi:hypothetical protein